MEINHVTLSVRSQELRSKGSFIVSPEGNMSPKTRHSTIWGKIDYSLIPYPFIANKNVVIPTNNSTLNEDGTPNDVSGFYKFSRSNFNVFAESLAMRVASLFDTKTCYNCPAKLNKDEDSINKALKDTVELNHIGTMVVSFLGKDEYLHTFANIGHDCSPNSDVQKNSNYIKEFVCLKNKDATAEEKTEIYTRLQKEYAYQYLFRDFFGDVDFTSRNSGLVHNMATNEITVAPQFDFGEVLNVLLAYKFSEPKFDSLENYPEHIRPFMKQETIDATNARRLEKYNATPTELGRIYTYGEEDCLFNIKYITKTMPDVTYSFLQDLNNFNNYGYMPVLIQECSNESSLITDEQVHMTQEFLQSRMDFYSEQLKVALQNYAPDFLAENGISLENLSSENFAENQESMEQ